MLGCHRFDRAEQSVNKAKNRMKSYFNRGKSAVHHNPNKNQLFNPFKHNRQGTSGDDSFQTGVFGLNAKGYSNNANGTRSSFNSTCDLNQFQNNCQVDVKLLSLVEKLKSESEYGEHVPLMKRLCSLKYKDILRECSLELQRRGGNFVCIYPSKGSENYDQFF